MPATHSAGMVGGRFSKQACPPSVRKLLQCGPVPLGFRAKASPSRSPKADTNNSLKFHHLHLHCNTIWALGHNLDVSSLESLWAQLTHETGVFQGEPTVATEWPVSLGPSTCWWPQVPPSAPGEPQPERRWPVGILGAISSRAAGFIMPSASSQSWQLSSSQKVHKFSHK